MSAVRILNKFVTGLSGRMDAPRLNPKGAQRLMSIRRYAQNESDALAPLCRRRFDGEWLPPDAQAIERKVHLDLIVQLVDIVVSDPDLAQSVANQLALERRGKPSSQYVRRARRVG